MFGFGKSEERKEIEKDLRVALEAGVDVRVTGRGTFILGAKNLNKIPDFEDRANRIRSLVKKRTQEA